MTDIKGLCSAGCTPHTCTDMHDWLKGTQTAVDKVHTSLKRSQLWLKILHTVWYPQIDARPNFVICTHVCVRSMPCYEAAFTVAKSKSPAHHGAEGGARRGKAKRYDAAEPSGRCHGAAHGLRPQVRRPSWLQLRRYRLRRR